MNPSSSGVFLHVGAAKTGTTTLQSNFFSRHSQIHYLGKHGDNPDAVALLRDVARTEPAAFDAERARANFEAIVGNADPARPIVLSHEALSDVKDMPRRERAERARTVFGPATVLIFLRSQIEVARSYYIFKERFRDYPDLRGWVAANAALAPSEREYGFAWMAYDELYHDYAEVFGAENVQVFLFEDLRADQAGCFEALCRCLGIDESEGARLGAVSKTANATYGSVRYRRWRRFRERVLPRNIAFSRLVPAFLFRRFEASMRGKIKVEIDPESRDTLTALYGPGNASLHAELGLPLADAGYPMPREDAHKA